MPGIKRSGTWTKNPFGTIWHAEAFPNSDQCLMCVHHIPHSLEEHATVLSKWPKPKALTKKARAKPIEMKQVDPDTRAQNLRRQRARKQFKKEVWARP